MDHVVVNGAAGHLCVVEVQGSWDVRTLKEAIFEVQGIKQLEQRLIHGLHELLDNEILEEILDLPHPEVTLVRRSQQQVEWLRIAEEDWSELLNQPSEVWEDKSVVTAAVTSCGWALRYASEALQNDQAVALAAVRQNGLALQFASSDLSGDAELALAAVAQCGRAFEFCSAELRRNRLFVLDAVGLNGHVLKYVDEDLQDAEVVNMAVDQCGSFLSDIVGTAFERTSRQSRIKHVLQDKGVLGAEHGPQKEIPRDLRSDSTCFFGLSSMEHVGLAKQLGKDASQLCEMANLGLPVPPGFCLTNASFANAKMALSQVEAFLQQGFGSLEKPLLLSLRGGSREVSGLGLTDEIAERMALQENANCVWDSYRRLLQSYAQIVCEVDPTPFDEELKKVKESLSARDWLGGKIEDWQLPTCELRNLVEIYKEILEDKFGEPFPQNPEIQLQKALEALENKKGSDGGAIIVESMVFGNYDFDSGVGVLNIRDGGLSGTWLPKAQPEDLGRRAGRRLSKDASQQWAEAHKVSESQRESEFLSLEEKFLPVCAGLAHCKDILSKAGHLDVDAVHFAVQQGRLWLRGPAPTTLGTIPAATTTETTASIFSEESLDMENLSFHPEEMAEIISNASDLPLPEDPLMDAAFLSTLPMRGPSSFSHLGVFRLPWFQRSRQPAESKKEILESNIPFSSEGSSSTSPFLALPLWQTMLAGGLACVCHRVVAGSIEEILNKKVASRPTAPALAQNVLKFSKGGFSFGALCCSFYVNFLHFSASGSSETVGMLERFSCASAAVTLASVATYPLNAGGLRGAALRPKHGMKALASTNPIAAVELCSIDMARQLGNSYGYPTGVGLLFASGCAAGCIAQSMVHAHNTLIQTRSPEPRSRREKFQAFCRAAGPSFLKHAPAVGMNSLVRVGLVTHFMNEQERFSTK